MNAFSNYSPMASFFGGFDMGERMNDAREQSRRAMIEEKEREALAQMGQGDQLAGFEGVEGAVRPQWLKALYQTNPQAAIQQEHIVAEPFRTNRDVQKAMEVERNKGQVHMDTAKNMLASFFGDQSPSEAGPVPASVSPVSMTEGGEPQAGAMPAGGGAMPQPNLMGLSGRKPKLKYGPQGLEITAEDMSPLEKGLAVSENQIKRADQALNEKKYDLSVEQQIGDKAKLADQLDTSRFNKVDAIHKQENELSKRIDQLKLQKSGGEISPKDYLDSANSIMGELKALKAQKEALLRGTSQAEQTLAINPKEYRNPSSREPQAVVPQTSATRDLPAPAPEQPTASRAMPRASSGGGSSLPYKQQVQLEQEAKQKEIASTRKSIDEARDAKQSIVSMMPKVKRQWDMLEKSDIGSSKMGNIPGGSTAMKIWSNQNDEFERLHDDLGKIFQKEGQSQLMNTLVERMMQTAGIPSISADPNTNRRNAVQMRNMIEQQIDHYPAFLEHWSRVNNGSLNGALDVYSEWANYSPMYIAKEDKGGNVTMHKNPGYIPVEKFLNLKANGKIQYIP